MSFLKRRFKGEQPDTAAESTDSPEHHADNPGRHSISALVASTLALAVPAAPDVLSRVAISSSSVPGAFHGPPWPQNPSSPAPATPKVPPRAETTASPARDIYQKIVLFPPTQQDKPPALDKVKEIASTTLHGLLVVAQGLKGCSDLFPPLKTAAAAILTLYEIFDGVSTNTEELKRLAARLEAILSLVQRYQEEGGLGAFKERVESFSAAIQALVEAIQHLQGRSLAIRTADVSNDSETIQKLLKDLNGVCDLFQIDIQFQTNTSIQNMLQLLNSRLIDELRPKGASYKTRRSAYGDPTGCMPGTRVNVLKTLEAQASDEEGVKVHWLAGMAGIGKSTIAQSLCELLEERQKLGASFFCSRASEKTDNARFIIPGVAYGLAKGSPTFKVELVRVLEKDPDLMELNDMQEQFIKLIVGPLRTAIDGRARVYKVVVIDALDECTDQNLVYRFIRVILKSASGLPLKFFLVSRADHSITAAFSSLQGSHDTFLLHEVEKEVVESDIRTYMKESLAAIKRDYGPNQEDGWPPDSEFSRIVKDAGKLFVYASTARRYIRDGGPNYRQRLTWLAERRALQQTSAIDGLYGGIHIQARCGREKEELSHLETLVSFIVFLRQPLSLNALSALSKISEPRKYLLLLNSVIHIPTEENAPVSVFHASFPEFLMGRCPPEVFPPVNGHAELTLKCLELMNRSLKYNICEVPEELSVSRMNRTNPRDGASKVSEALKYACIYWATHLSEVQDSSMPTITSVIDALREFLKTHLLYWMECLSIVGELKTGLKSLVRADAALSQIQITDTGDLRRLVGDARRFLQLSFERIQKDCFEVYQSAYALIPKKSLMHQVYGAQMRPRYIIMGLPDSWGPMEHWMDGGSVIRSVAFSPDGAQVASGSLDGMVRIWNAGTGEAEARLEGHMDGVCSVAFSPDCAQVASGSVDGTVRIWNAGTGEAEARLEGHMDGVCSVAFSPDGARVALGSVDEMVRIRNARTGEVEARLKGHTGGVSSVAFSPDGARVASGSQDGTVRIWNAGTGEAVARLDGHTGWVWSVAFSPGGARVASGSEDGTVRIWNAGTGEAVALLEGHTRGVYSVAFSPDGARVASGSEDGTVRIWNARTGAAVARLEGHTGGVCSVTFSPDGARVASGSEDGTVRIWSAGTGESVARLEGHTGGVCSVAFSPDSARVASGSEDGTVTIWNAGTGKAAARLEGHTGGVYSVAFSPDGVRVALGSEDGTVRIWNAGTGEAEARLGDHMGWVWSVAFSPDGTRVASGSQDGTVRIWNARTGESVARLEGHTDGLRSVAFSPDGARIALGSQDGMVRIWNAGTGKVARLEGHTGGVCSVAFSPDGARVASGSQDGTVRIWNAGTGEAEARLDCHTGVVCSVAFSHDGARVALGSQNGTVRIWNVGTGVGEARSDGHMGSVL